jgi:hypothetical protein
MELGSRYAEMAFETGDGVARPKGEPSLTRRQRQDLHRRVRRRRAPVDSAGCAGLLRRVGANRDGAGRAGCGARLAQRAADRPCADAASQARTDALRQRRHARRLQRRLAHRGSRRRGPRRALPGTPGPEGRAAALARCLPLGIASNARDCSRRSFQSGHISSTTIQVKGDLWEFPFPGSRDGELRLHARDPGPARHRPGPPCLHNRRCASR